MEDKTPRPLGNKEEKKFLQDKSPFFYSAANKQEQDKQ
jgi:hypothetical protein